MKTDIFTFLMVVGGLLPIVNYDNNGLTRPEFSCSSFLSDNSKPVLKIQRDYSELSYGFLMIRVSCYFSAGAGMIDLMYSGHQPKNSRCIKYGSNIVCKYDADGNVYITSLGSNTNQYSVAFLGLTNMFNKKRVNLSVISQSEFDGLTGLTDIEVFSV